MRQIWIPRAGGPEVLDLREAAGPLPGAAEVRIRVVASFSFERAAEAHHYIEDRKNPGKVLLTP